MTIRLKQHIDDVPLSQMVDGEIGVITKFGTDESLIGKVVQRLGPRLIFLGEPLGKSLPSCFLLSDPGETLRYKPLKSGDLLEIT